MPPRPRMPCSAAVAGRPGAGVRAALRAATSAARPVKSLTGAQGRAGGERAGGGCVRHGGIVGGAPPAATPGGGGEGRRGAAEERRNGSPDRRRRPGGPLVGGAGGGGGRAGAAHPICLPGYNSRGGGRPPSRGEPQTPSPPPRVI